MNDTASFSEQLKNSGTDVISYEGSDDIIIDSTDASAKTVTINTTGSVALDSPVDTLILNGAANGFTANARAESIVLAGSGITAELNSETETVLIKGKDITVNVRNSSVKKLIVINISAIVTNLTEADIFVTLANGTKVTVPANHTYRISDNTLQKN